VWVANGETVDLARSPHNASLRRDLEGGRVVDLPGAPRRPYGNLPLELTSFVGRERETAEVKRSLDDFRLLTLTGPGGCGKTRLAVAVGEELTERFEGGVWWVELAPVSVSALVPRAVASALGVHEQVGRSLGDLLRDHLEPRRLLLILDNCEHLIEACAKLANTLLRSCPDLRILATSREAMGIAGENVVLVPSLSLPDPQAAVEGLPRGDAVRLFVDRATTVAPDFVLDEQNAPALARICQRLDGLPLAIELAAAKVKVLSVEQISTRLDDCFRLLGTDSRTLLPHHRTLRATMDWSHELLGRKERILFRRLSAFSGGFTLEAAEEVCARGDIGASEVLAWLSPGGQVAGVGRGAGRRGTLPSPGDRQGIRAGAAPGFGRGGTYRQASRSFLSGSRRACRTRAYGRAARVVAGPPGGRARQPAGRDRVVVGRGTRGGLAAGGRPVGVLLHARPLR